VNTCQLPIPEVKPWWQSRIIIAAAVSAVLQLVKALGIEVPCVKDDVVSAVLDLTTVATSVYIIYKRQSGPQTTTTKIVTKNEVDK
jgi:hypothetical protein